MKRPIVIKSLIETTKIELNKPTIWKRIKSFFLRKYLRRVFTYRLIAEVDSLRRVGTNDVILGQNGTAWIVTHTGHLTKKDGEKAYIEILSHRPYTNCNIIGNALVIDKKRLLTA